VEPEGIEPSYPRLKVGSITLSATVPKYWTCGYVYIGEQSFLISKLNQTSSCQGWNRTSVVRFQRAVSVTNTEPLAIILKSGKVGVEPTFSLSSESRPTLTLKKNKQKNPAQDFPEQGSETFVIVSVRLRIPEPNCISSVRKAMYLHCLYWRQRCALRAWRKLSVAGLVAHYASDRYW